MTLVSLCPLCRPHKYQDSTYGLKMRVMNSVKSDPNRPKCKCTVCSTVKDIKAKD